jgi:hypothetical protein
MWDPYICVAHPLANGRSRSWKVPSGHCGQRPSVAEDGVAAGKKAELPDQIEWSGTGLNCPPSAFQDGVGNQAQPSLRSSPVGQIGKRAIASVKKERIVSANLGHRGVGMVSGKETQDSEQDDSGQDSKGKKKILDILKGGFPIGDVIRRAPLKPKMRRAS